MLLETCNPALETVTVWKMRFIGSFVTTPETTRPIKIMPIHIEDTVKDKNELSEMLKHCKQSECAVFWLPLQK